MSSDNGIDALCAALLEGKPIDWDHELAAVASDPEQVRVVRNLQRLYAIEHAHHRLRFVDSGDLPFRQWRHLQIERRIGSGAHGELFQAIDESLGQRVALKLYHETPSSLIARDELLAEARRLARIRHDNVVLVHGVDVDHGRVGFWMEYLSGESLADRLERGRLPAQHVVDIGIALCRALGAAHAAKVLHGDIKPTNVLCTKEGKTCLVDFGAGRSIVAGAETSLKRIGTPLFMAPETLLEGTLTERSDIYSLGALLFHASSLQYPIEADDLESLKAGHEERLRRDSTSPPDPRFPSLVSLRPDAPRRLIATIERCLRPDPEQRFETAAALEQALAPAPAGFRISTRMRIVAAALAVALGGVGLWLWRAQQSQRTLLQLPHPVKAIGRAVALSPDGRDLVFVADEGDHTSLYRVDARTGNARPISNTENATAPFFSPDGTWLAFSANHELRRLRFHEPNALPIRICDRASGPGTWSVGDTIVFSGARGDATGLHKVAALGDGIVRQIYWHENRRYPFWPQFTPAGDAVVFVEGDHSISSYDEAGIMRVSLAGAMSPVRGPDAVLRGGQPWPVASGGRFFFWRDGEILSAFCDSGVTRVWAIEPVSGVRTAGSLGYGGFDLSRDLEVLVYLPERPLPGRSLVVADLRSTRRPAPLPAGRTDEQRYDYSARFSPAGDLLAVVGGDLRGDANHNLYILDPVRRIREPLVIRFGDAHSPTWSADGRTIAFSAVADGMRGRHIFCVPSDGSKPPTLLLQVTSVAHPTSWSARGWLAFHDQRAPAPGQMANSDIRLLDTATGATRAFEATPSDEAQARFSPDGRWIAFASNRDGAWEVYVKRADAAAAARPRRVSHGGGHSPVWTPDGARLYYRRADSLFALEAAALETRPVSVGVAAFQDWLDPSTSGAAEPTYDVRPDGCIVLVTEPKVVHDEIVVVRNAGLWRRKL